MTTSPELAPHRAYARVNGRRVHYRRWGTGPAVLAIHGSPQSSRTMETLGLRLAAAGFCVIAPDTPGNGLSSPLTIPGAATTIDYAQALLDFADQLGLGRFAIYGFHTGAAIACTLAVRNPERVTALACDGLPAWSDVERQTILQGYLPKFEPSWDAAHMAWLWARLEEQTVFFPWQLADDLHRMDYDVSGVQHLHANALDLLESGDHYRKSYHAAFTFEVADWLPRLDTPALITAMALDPLAAHYQRPCFAQTSTQAFEQLADMYAAIEQLFLQHPGDVVGVLPAGATDEFGLNSGWVGEPGKALAWTGNIFSAPQRLTDGARPLVLLHDAGGSQRVFQTCLSELARQRPVVALDLPGHGCSDRRAADAPDSVAAIGEEIATACARLGLKSYDVAGLHLGGLIAAWLVNAGHAHSGATLGITRVDAAAPDDWCTQYAPSLQPEFDGAHLLRAFRVARWERLFFPWFKRQRGHAIHPAANLEASDIHLRARDLLRAGASWQAAVTAEASYDLLQECPPAEKFAVLAIANDPRSAEPVLASLQRKVIRLGRSATSWTTALAQLGQ